MGNLSALSIDAHSIYRSLWSDPGDTIGLEIEVFEHNMSVALFSKNGMPVGTRYLTLKDQSQFYPTVALCGNGSSVEVEIIWQNSIASPPLYSVVSSWITYSLLTCCM